MTVRKLTLLALAASLAACAGALLTAPPGSTINLFANPGFIPANGGVSTITALVVEPAGTTVPDGTVVYFFTTLGKVDRQGKTKDGVARVNLIGDSRSGIATVTAVSGGAGGGEGGGTGTDFVDVNIGTILPDHIIMTADPTRITTSRTSHIIANVFDASGNPVANVPVFFTTNGATETMESGGNPVFTDTNGRAEDTLRTKYPHDAAFKTVTVTATTSDGTPGIIMVTIN